MSEITIEVWAAGRIREFTKFLDWWKAEQAKSAGGFPSWLSPGEWDEQLEAWAAMQKGGNEHQ